MYNCIHRDFKSRLVTMGTHYGLLTYFRARRRISALYMLYIICRLQQALRQRRRLCRFVNVFRQRVGFTYIIKYNMILKYRYNSRGQATAGFIRLRLQNIVA